MELDRFLLNEILDRAPIARMALIDLDGGAQALPFVFSRVDGAIWSPIDGKPKKRPNLNRIAWLEKSPNVCVCIDHYDDNWDQLWWLKLYCRATVVRETHRDWDAAIATLMLKYPQYQTVPLLVGEPTMVQLEWQHHKAWCASDSALIAGTLPKR